MPVCNIGCIVMASGISKRFGSNKLIAQLNGKPLIEYSVSIANMNEFCESVLVTRSNEIALACKDLIPVLTHDYPLKADAICLGIEKLLESNNNLDGMIFLQADQPLIKETTIKKLCETFRKSPNSICRVCFGKIIGTPVIFPKILFDELKNIKDGNGGVSIINRHIDLVTNVDAYEQIELLDIDTPDDLLTAEKYINIFR